MDKVMKVTLALFLIILAAFTGYIAYNRYAESAYRESIAGTYSYACTITTDGILRNVTFFLPVPADGNGNSPIVSAFSNQTITGIPADWNPTLFDTGKATLVKITTPSLVPPQGTSPVNPSTIRFEYEFRSKSVIDTLDPVGRSAMFRPVHNIAAGSCPPGAGSVPGGQCESYTTSLYADYLTTPETNVTIRASVTGRNTWNVFGPHANEYRTDVIVVMKGTHKGWADLAGSLERGAGSYDIPGGS